MSLRLDYTLDDMIINRLEAQARRHGLPLAQVEMLGRSASLALAFIKAAEADDLDHFYATVDFDVLEQKIYA